MLPHLRPVLESGAESGPECEAADSETSRRVGAKQLPIGEHDGCEALLGGGGREEPRDEVLACPMRVTWRAAAGAECAGLTLKLQHPPQHPRGSCMVGCSAKVQHFVHSPNAGHYLSADTSIHSGTRAHILQQACC